VQISGLYMCAPLLAGCVVPPALEEEPPEPNLPPVIVRDDDADPLLPESDFGFAHLDPKDDLEVRIPVDEPNLNDRLELRVFLDEIRLVQLEPPPPGGVRRVFRTIVDLPCALVLSDSAGLLVGVVSDRGFDGPDREVPADAGTSSVEWVIDCGGTQ
jgi:hypothetical protein